MTAVEIVFGDDDVLSLFERPVIRLKSGRIIGTGDLHGDIAIHRMLHAIVVSHGSTDGEVILDLLAFRQLLRPFMQLIDIVAILIDLQDPVGPRVFRVGALLIPYRRQLPYW